MPKIFYLVKVWFVSFCVSLGGANQNSFSNYKNVKMEVAKDILCRSEIIWNELFAEACIWRLK